MATVKVIKFQTGTYVISEVRYEKSNLMEKFGMADMPDRMVLVNPAEILFAPDNKTDRMSVSLIPMMLFTDEKEHPIDPTWILALAEPESQILNAYNAQFGSGIVVPPSGGKITL